MVRESEADESNEGPENDETNAGDRGDESAESEAEAIEGGTDVDEPEGLTVDEISAVLDEDEVGMALVLTATRLERELGYVARAEMDISRFAFLEDWAETGLAKLVKFNEYMEWIEDEEPILSIAGFRTDIVHNYEELQPVLADQETREVVVEIIRDALEIIEQLEANRSA